MQLIEQLYYLSLNAQHVAKFQTRNLMFLTEMLKRCQHPVHLMSKSYDVKSLTCRFIKNE